MPIVERDRVKRIGGSEASVPIHVHPFLSEFGLYLRKTQDIGPDEVNDRMRLGKYLEQGIAAYAAELMGWDDLEWCDRTIYSLEYPFMVYTPDALRPAAREGLDSKLVFWDQAHFWRDGPADHAKVQAMYYMAGTDYVRWHIAALIAGEARPRIHTIERNAAVEKALLKKVEGWWQIHIVDRIPPPITASEQTDRWLKRRYPKPKTELVAAATPEEEDLLDAYAKVRGDRDRFDHCCEDLEARIKAAIGERSGLRWSGGRFTWKSTKDSTYVDWEALARTLVAAHPRGEDIRKEFTHPKPGHRRMYFSDKRGKEREIE